MFSFFWFVVVLPQDTTIRSTYHITQFRPLEYCLITQLARVAAWFPRSPHFRNGDMRPHHSFVHIYAWNVTAILSFVHMSESCGTILCLGGCRNNSPLQPPLYFFNVSLCKSFVHRLCTNVHAILLFVQISVLCNKILSLWSWDIIFPEILWFSQMSSISRMTWGGTHCTLPYYLPHLAKKGHLGGGEL